MPRLSLVLRPNLIVGALQQSRFQRAPFAAKPDRSIGTTWRKSDIFLLAAP
jgi:hypothetical protein